jgi:hypothetical protein
LDFACGALDVACCRRNVADGLAQALAPISSHSEYYFTPCEVLHSVSSYFSASLPLPKCHTRSTMRQRDSPFVSLWSADVGTAKGPGTKSAALFLGHCVVTGVSRYSDICPVDGCHLPTGR